MDDIEAVRGNSSSGGGDRGIGVNRIQVGDDGVDGSGGDLDGVGQAGDTNSDLYATVGDKVVQQRAMPGREYNEKL